MSRHKRREEAFCEKIYKYYYRKWNFCPPTWPASYLAQQYIDRLGIDHSLDGCTEEEIQKIFMLQTAKLVTNAASLREESRGAHIREDFPLEDDRWKDIHIVQSKKGIEMRRRKNERHQIKSHA